MVIESVRCAVPGGEIFLFVLSVFLKLGTLFTFFFINNLVHLCRGVMYPAVSAG